MRATAAGLESFELPPMTFGQDDQLQYAFFPCSIISKSLGLLRAHPIRVPVCGHDECLPGFFGRVVAGEVQCRKMRLLRLPVQGFFRFFHPQAELKGPYESLEAAACRPYGALQ